MLAPTGRAAKVINHYTGDDASTIHRYLYEIKSDKNGDIKTKVKPNKFKKQIFIIDESSMISNEDDKTLFKGASLLSDLVDHVYSQADNAIVFIGDTAQLPPVGLQCSPALDQNFLQNNCQLQVRQYELKEVVRQQLHSGILANAHCTRLLLEREEHFPRLKTSGFDDVNQVTSAELSEALSGYFPSGDDNTVTVLCRSNKQANRYNEFIRKTFYGFEEVVEKNERLMVVKNNYYWYE
ncbi:AAA family ATPase, partial [uncultured Flavobacterium sp.]|uniref:AAA family ATPase n=1 Tax=uncultured Flavobacterium sp. TaxID=165435 RepID=UPI00259842F2